MVYECFLDQTCEAYGAMLPMFQKLQQHHGSDVTLKLQMLGGDVYVHSHGFLTGCTPTIRVARGRGALVVGHSPFA